MFESLSDNFKTLIEASGLTTWGFLCIWAKLLAELSKPRCTALRIGFQFSFSKCVLSVDLLAGRDKSRDTNRDSRKEYEMTSTEQAGEYYVELDENGTWSIFHTDIESGKAFGSYTTKYAAEVACKGIQNES